MNTIIEQKQLQIQYGAIMRTRLTVNGDHTMFNPAGDAQQLSTIAAALETSGIPLPNVHLDKNNRVVVE